ncbi:hypothetical protein KY290_010073 [Solanum tuberosum]|uniref:Uncharacterized protein n=1 Tax=Solanum tuberosum TaxID=4113 RepID=A0ABQ7VY19_SOLTU|nr:hypothetical protein KY289_010455 [Solanum tuberosum]KAH0708597.1 hypothetical protein KY284_010024 [Solanum tuberosum]KAH0772936.1 hypothetical protein KY290_010073 [Solanum tuberosum]
MEAFGWLGNFIVAHMISTYLTLDTALYLAIFFGLITFFCWLMLLRPVASDWGTVTAQAWSKAKKKFEA